MSKDLNPIIEQEVGNIMQSAYINYAMAVLTDRALPDIRDGLKPVHRRILYAMNGLHLHSNTETKKCARIVGEVLGKYHPHGDTAVYDALARMAQDFSLRYPLIIGQGNFGSIDGDPPAAFRYTEAKLSPYGDFMLDGVNNDIVDFIPNFDETTKEPILLPSKFPNLIVNGSVGIAVGMATNMPPHNINEVIKAIEAIIINKKITNNEIYKIIKGPDFPTGGVIIGTADIKETYNTGKGKIIIRGDVDCSENGKIIITAIPFGVNKLNMIQKIDNAIKEEKISNINHIRDESNKNGIRVVLELKKGSDKLKILKDLYKYTDLQINYGISNIVLVDGVPKQVSMREMLEEYIKFQREITVRKHENDLIAVKKRMHFLEGLDKVKDCLDEIIKIIRTAKKVSDAKETIIKKYDLDDEQAQGILDLKLQKLVNAEILLLLKEYLPLKKEKSRLEKILKSPKLIDNIILEYLKEFSEKYGDKRRTKIFAKEPSLEDLSKKKEKLSTSQKTISSTNKKTVIKSVSKKTNKTKTTSKK